MANEADIKHNLPITAITCVVFSLSNTKRYSNYTKHVAFQQLT